MILFALKKHKNKIFVSKKNAKIIFIAVKNGVKTLKLLKKTQKS